MPILTASGAPVSQSPGNPQTPPYGEVRAELSRAEMKQLTREAVGKGIPCAVVHAASGENVPALFSLDANVHRETVVFDGITVHGSIEF